MRIYTFLWVALAMLCREEAVAKSLDEWLLEKVQQDEQFLTKSLSQTDGHSLELLPYARFYVPFFYEAPAKYDFESAEQKAKFDAWLANGRGKGFLPGGYIYRLRFDDAQTLYATSAGSWELEVWHSLDLNKDLIIDSARVWSGSRNDFLYATTVAGALTKIIVYDQHGEVKKEEVFNVNDADFEQRLAAAELTYAGKGTPTLEMLSLAEYLKKPDTQWRRLELSEKFNFRNQQRREVERSILRDEQRLTRHDLVQALETSILFAAEGLFFETSSSETVTTYDLQLKIDNSVKTIWSTKLPFIKGTKPSDHCGLAQWQRNEQGMLVLISYTELWGGVLLQFGPNDELMAEIGVGREWLRPDIFGHIKFEPPDKIKFLKGGGMVVDEYSIKKGTLCDKDGKPIQRKVENNGIIGKTASGDPIHTSKKERVVFPNLYKGSPQPPKKPDTPPAVPAPKPESTF